MLLGPGMYVNRGLALGLGVETTADDLATIEHASRAAGVPAEAEVTPLAHPSLLQVTAARGYRPVRFGSTLLAAVRAQPRVGDVVEVDEVGSGAGLAQWQATVAEGFGYTSSDDRRTSDLYSTAISLLDQTRLYIARLAGDAVGAAALTIRDDVAILGG